MIPGPQSYLRPLVDAALTVAVICLALKLAAAWLLAALPVLLPAAAVGGLVLAWRWWSGRGGGW